MNDHPNLTNIKEVRWELKRWGRFWASKEFSRGYASRSSAASVIEACKVGLASRATVPSDIKIPRDIQTIDNKLNALTDAQRTAIVLGDISKVLTIKNSRTGQGFTMPHKRSGWYLRVRGGLVRCVAGSAN